MAEKQESETHLESELLQLDALQNESESFLKRRVTLWGIRWSIGFALIWAVVSYQPAWNWLWWVGAALAVLSLGSIFLGRIILKRKFEQVRSSAEEVRATAEELEKGDI